MIPTFAVVGHPNKGKSSIVATLAEDERLAIGPMPGTTRRAVSHTFTIDGQPQYVLVDTPGFQRAGAVLEWIESRVTTASGRPQVVADFVAAHKDDPRFSDEVELLQPLLEGAGILYVVDGSKPYGSEYELEMQILQWTGRPRMALINMIGTEDHQAEWRQALDQYFSLVRVFDAVAADFETRVSLLTVFGELDEDWRDALAVAVDALVKERERRRKRSAAEIAACIIESLALVERMAVGDEEEVEPFKARLVERLQKQLRKREERSRETVQGFYRHEALKREDSAASLLSGDLFAEEGWELFGLSRQRLLLSGTLTGALAGGGIDVLLGGASLALGAGIGAVVGGAGAWFGGGELAKVKVLGETLGGRVVQAGPVKAPNFPWVLLGRAWVHQQLVAERNHAYREAISVAVRTEQNLMDVLPDDLRRSLSTVFSRILGRSSGEGLHGELTGLVAELLTISLTDSPSAL